MTLRQLWTAWNNFWFAPQSPTPICLFRILYGLLVLQYCFFIAPDLFTWFGTKGVLSSETANQVLGTPCLNLFVLYPNSDGFVLFLFSSLVIAAICLTLGLFTRYSAIVVFLAMVSFSHRNTLIINSGDVLLRIFAFYLVLSEAGAMWSIDSLIQARFSAKEGRHRDVLVSPWAQRLLQVQMAIIYCHAFWTKIVGDSWLDGTAVYYVLQEKEFLRFPVPFVLEHFWMSQLLSWGTMAIEFALWTLVWIKEFRLPVLFLGVLLHLGIDWSMNLPVFEYLMIAGLVNFLEPAEVTAAVNCIKSFCKRQSKIPEPI